jgi:hypothetical protein
MDGWMDGCQGAMFPSRAQEILVRLGREEAKVCKDIITIMIREGE